MFRTPATVLVAFALSACTTPIVPEDDTASETDGFEDTNPVEPLPEDPIVVTVTLSFIPLPDGVTYARQGEPAPLGGIDIAVDPIDTRVIFERIAPKIALAIEEWLETPSAFSTDPTVPNRDRLVGECTLQDLWGTTYGGPIGIEGWDLTFDDGFVVYGGESIAFSTVCTPPDGTNPYPLAFGIDLPIEEDGEIEAYAEDKEGNRLELQFEYRNMNGLPYPSSYVLLPYDLGWPGDSPN